MRRQVNRNHILEKKPSTRTRRLAGEVEVTGGDRARVQSPARHLIAAVRLINVREES